MSERRREREKQTEEEEKVVEEADVCVRIQKLKNKIYNFSNITKKGKENCFESIANERDAG